MNRKFSTPCSVTDGIGSALHAAVVTPSDSTPLAQPATALWIGGAGNVAVQTVGGETVTFLSVAAGTLLPIQVAYVMQTNTTSGNILALWT